MPSNPVVWFEVYVRDMARARQFYEGVFDLKLQPLEVSGLEMWRFPMQDGAADGINGALIRMEGFEPGVGGTLVYFECADCAVEADRAAARGGALVKAKTSIGTHGYYALVRDTEGNLIGLHAPP